MSEIKSVLLTVCITAVALGLFKAIVPDGKYKGQISFLCACIFILAAVNGISGLKLQAEDFFTDVRLESSVTDDGGYYDRLKLCALQTAQTTAEKEIQGYLQSEGYSPEKIKVTAHIDDSLCISINEIQLVFGGDIKTAKAASQLIKDRTDGTVTVSVIMQRGE